MTRRRRDQGVVLINVLVVLALASTVVYAMIALADISIRRSQRFSEAEAALALVEGGEVTAIAALRRDMTEHPQSDDGTEAWAKVAQDDVEIASGRFALRIEDAQDRFNLNTLLTGGLAAQAVFANIVKALALHEDVQQRIAARLIRLGPLTRMQDLAFEAGVAAADIEKLSTLVTVLPGRTDININAAPEALIAVLAQNPVQARFLTATRTRDGRLTPDDVRSARVTLPAGVGFRSAFFKVTVTVTIGGTEQSMTSLLQRRLGPGNRPEVAVVARQNARAAALPLPPG